MRSCGQAGATSTTNDAWRVRRGSRTRPSYQPHGEPSRNGDLQKLLGCEVVSAECGTSIFRRIFNQRRGCRATLSTYHPVAGTPKAWTCWFTPRQRHCGSKAWFSVALELFISHNIIVLLSISLVLRTSVQPVSTRTQSGDGSCPRLLTTIRFLL